MTKVFDQTTTNGHLTGYLGTEAAERAAREIANHVAGMSGNDTTRGISAGAISAGAAVVGALTGIRNLSGGSTQAPSTIELQIINMSSYIIVPWKSKTSRCSLQEAARPITPNDSVSLKGIWAEGAVFEENVSRMNLSFVVGDIEKSIQVSVTLFFNDKLSWVMKDFSVDGCTIPAEDIVPGDQGGETLAEEIQAVTYIGNTGYPSFSMYSHTIRNLSGKTYLEFTNAVA